MKKPENLLQVNGTECVFRFIADHPLYNIKKGQRAILTVQIIRHGLGFQLYQLRRNPGITTCLVSGTQENIFSLVEFDPYFHHLVITDRGTIRFEDWQKKTENPQTLGMPILESMEA